MGSSVWVIGADPADVAWTRLFSIIDVRYSLRFISRHLPPPQWAFFRVAPLGALFIGMLEAAIGHNRVHFVLGISFHPPVLGRATISHGHGIVDSAELKLLGVVCEQTQLVVLELRESLSGPSERVRVAFQLFAIELNVFVAVCALVFVTHALNSQ